MSRKERITHELGFLSEKHKTTINVILAIFTGIAGTVYAVLSGEKPMMTLILGLVGLVLIFFMIRIVNKINRERQELLDELERIE